MQANNPLTTATIDRTKLLERCLGIDSFAEKIVTSFVATLPTERATLRAAAHSTDMAQIARCSHRLKGSASNVCAAELSAAAADVENAAKNNLVDSVEGLIHRLEVAVDRILLEFENGSSQP